MGATPRPANLMKGNQLIISRLENALKLMNLIVIASTKLKSMLCRHSWMLTNHPPTTLILHLRLNWAVKDL